jgi:predicted DNA-binding protein YlxM (UPF0122 family)
MRKITKEILQPYINKGYSMKETCEALNVCRDTLTRNGFPRKKDTTKLQKHGDDIEYLYKLGIRVADIAKHFDMQHNQITRYIADLELKRDPAYIKKLIKASIDV